MPLRPSQRDLFGHRSDGAMVHTHPMLVPPWERGRRALRRRGWLLGLILALTCGSGWLAGRWLSPVYRASESVEWQAPLPAVQFSVPGPAAAEPAPGTATELETLAQNLGSRKRVARIARQLGPALALHWWIRRPPAPSLTPTAAMALTDAAMRQLRVTPVLQSRILHLQFEAPRADLAAKFLNALTADYIASAADRHRQLGLERVQTLALRAGAARGQVQAAQAAVAGFAARHRLADPASALTLANTRRRQLVLAATAAQVAAVRQSDALTLAGVASAAPVEIAAERAKIAAEIGRLQAIYQPGAAPLLAAQQQLAGLDRSLTQWNRAVRDDATRSLAAERRQARDLSLALAEQAGTERQLAQSLAEFDLEQRGLDARQTTYSNLLAQLQQAVAQTGGGPAPLRVSDPATPPLDPVRPNPKATLAYSLVLGVLLGSAALWAAERWDDHAMLPEAAELGTPLVAVLPAAPFPSAAPEPEVGAGAGEQSGTSAPRRHGPEAVPHAGPARFPISSALEDALEPLAAALVLAQADYGAQVVFLTSAGAGEGKSTVACHLARQLARTAAPTSGRVLWIHTGAAEPALLSAVRADGQAATPGLRTLLAGQASVEDVLRRWEPGDGRPAIAWIPAGTADPNSSYTLHLAAGAGQDLLRAARQRYDWILVDGNTLASGPEVAIWAGLADYNLVVAAHGRGSLHQLRQALDVVEAAGGAPLCLVLNRVPRRVLARTAAWAPLPPRPEPRNLDADAWRQRA